VPLPGPGRRLDVKSSGSVGLDDQSLAIKLVLPIPADLRQDRPLLAALAGKTISVGVAGKLGAPQVVFDGSIGQVAGDVAREFIERVRGGGVPPAGPPVPGVAAPPGVDGDAVADIVGGVIDEIARRRAARQAAEAAAEVPPRRGRLRERVLRPVLPPAPPASE